jgi:hypothetical protein
VNLRRILLALLAAGGLSLYLWPALHAPVVRWSDSEADLGWARRGQGILSPAPAVSPSHPAKPGYLLFLRATMTLAGDRGIVVAQSILLWTSIAVAAILLGRRRGAPWGVALYVLLVLFLRLRDSASAVMSEALTAALLLPLVALLLDPPERPSRVFLVGVAVAVLSLVRPNAGGAVLILSLAAVAFAGGLRRVSLISAGFLIVWVPVWIATEPAHDPLRGLQRALLTGSADYAWLPGGVTMPRPTANWIAAFQGSAADVGRQLSWRAFHGLLGTEFYDGRWSRAYSFATAASRMVSPFLILGSLAILLSAPRARGGGAKLLGLILFFLLVGQSLVLGALPRFVLPLLPAILFFALAALPELLRSRTGRLAGPLVFGLLIWAVAGEKQLVDQEWGVVESAGRRILQRIPRGALPAHGPATLHIRVAPPLLPSSAGLQVFGPDGAKLYDSSTDASREKAFVSVPLPPSLLETDRNTAVDVILVSTGDYDAFHYLLFPVIPPPWGVRAVREASSDLSPHSGIARGSLDWWAHPGAP